MPRGKGSELAEIMGPETGPMVEVEVGGEDDMGPSDDFYEAAAEAFPDMSDAQLDALYEAIKACK